MYCGAQQTPLALDAIPKFWGLLSNADRFQYSYLRQALATPTNKNNRNRRVESFQETMEAVKKFCVKGDGDDWRRYLVTGICWLPEGGIAVNTHQLRLLVSKCKSSINGSLHKMGYVHSMVRQDAAEALIRLVPPLKDNPAELRQWTVRLDHPVDNTSAPSPAASPVTSFEDQVPLQIFGAAYPAVAQVQIEAPKESVFVEQEDSLDSFATDFQLDFGMDAPDFLDFW